MKNNTLFPIRYGYVIVHATLMDDWTAVYFQRYDKFNTTSDNICISAEAVDITNRLVC